MRVPLKILLGEQIKLHFKNKTQLPLVVVVSQESFIGSISKLPVLECINTLKPVAPSTTWETIY